MELVGVRYGLAMLSRGRLRLLLNAPGAGGAGQPMPDGSRPEPGAGTAYRSRSTTFPSKCESSEGLAPTSKTMSSRYGEESRPSSMTQLGTRLSS